MPEDKNAGGVELRKILPKTQPGEAIAFRATKFESWPCRRPMVYENGFSSRISVVHIRHLVLWKCNCKGELGVNLRFSPSVISRTTAEEVLILFTYAFSWRNRRETEASGEKGISMLCAIGRRVLLSRSWWKSKCFEGVSVHGEPCDKLAWNLDLDLIFVGVFDVLRE